MTKILSFAVAAAALSLVGGCTTAPPPPAARPIGPPRLPPPPPPPPVAEWRDRPLSPGTWSYGAEPSGSSARFGPPGMPALVIRCDKAARVVHFEMIGASLPGALTITTSYGARSLPLAAGAHVSAEASLPANDPLLDQIAFSRGRVSYAPPAQSLLMTPAWAEPARVIEDCRG